MAKSDKLSGARAVDDDFDVPDFDFDSLEGKDDRKPATRIAHGLGAGLKNTITDTSFIKKMLRTVLPEGYGMAMDFSDEVHRNARQLYNNAAKEIKPSIAEMAKAADKLAPASMPYLKKTLGGIDKWADEQKAAVLKSDDKDDLRNAGLALTLGETFRFQMSANAKSEARKESRDRLKEGMDIGRHKDIFGLLNNINLSTGRLAQYQDKITINFQRKILESSLRTQFTIIDLLTETKAQNAFMKSSMSAIQKNTGLPDFVKLNESERLESLLRTRLASKLFDNDVTKKFSDHIGKVVKEKVSSFKDKLATATAGLDAAHQAKEGLEQIDDKVGTGAEIFSETGLKWLAEKLAGGRKDFLAKHTKIATGNEMIKNALGNAGAHIKAFKKNNKLTYKDNLLSKIISFAQELTPDLGPDLSVKKDGINDLNKPHIFTKQTHKSINEVIPGFLSRIFRELQVTRTGDQNIGLTTYDVTKNKFHDVKIANKNYKDFLISKEDIEKTTEELKTLLDLVDPDRKMSPSARLALGKKLLSQKVNNEDNGMAGLTDRNTFAYDPITKDHADEIHGTMLKHFGVNKQTGPGNNLELLQKQNKFTSAQKNVGKYLDNPADKIQEMMNLGMHDFISNNDLVAENGTIDIDKLLNYAGGVGGLDSKEDIVFKNRSSKKKPLRSTKKGHGIKIPSFAVGTPYVPHDMFAKIHEGENILTKEENSELINQLKLISSSITSGNEEQGVYFTALMKRLSRMGTGNGTSGQNSYNDLKDDVGDIYNKGNINIKNFLKKTKNIVLSRGRKGIENIHSAKDVALVTGTKALGIALPFTKKWFDKGVEKYKELSDLYIPGINTPVIKANMLKAGMYMDVKTNKVITSISDITGQVKDKAGNIILEASDLKNLFERNNVTGTIIKVGDYFKNKLNLTRDFITNTIPPIFNSGINLLKYGIDKVKNYLDEPVDIYIPGIKLPVLTALLMRNGAYFLNDTSAPVLRPSDIKGDIKDLSGKIVLTTDQIRKGLFDINGKPIRTPVDKIRDFVKNRIQGGIARIRKAASAVKNTVKGIAKRGVQFLADGLGGFVDNVESTDLLTKIYNVLDDRLPNNGGNSKSSSKYKSAKVTDKVKHNKDANGERLGSWRSQKKQTGHHENVGAKAKEGVAAVKKAESGEGLIGSLIGILTSLFSGKGLIGKALNVGRTLLGVGGAALPMLGTAATAVGGALSTGAVAIGGSLATAASFVGTALVGTLSVLGSIISSPVVLGALAVGALAYGGYKLYKYLNRKPSPLVALRMVQYGFTPNDNKNIEKVLQLEDLLLKRTGVKSGRAFIDVKGFEEDKALAIFNVSKEDESALNSWTSWFAARFKPVYLTHYTAIAATDNKMLLEDVDKFKPALKIHYLDLAHFPEGPYNIGNNPDSTSDTKLTIGADVEAAFKVAKEAATKELKTMKSNTRLGVATEAMTGEKAAAKLDAKQAKADGVNNKADGIGGAAASASDAQNLSAAGNAPVYRKSGMIESLEGARFRTYGLITMESEKVNALRQLEDLVTDGAKYSGNGAATFTNDTDAIMEAVGSVFGVAKNTTNGNNWLIWFKKRFLPVYLTYLGLVKQIAGGELKKGRLPSLKPSQELTIVNQTSAVAGVWGVSTSPWEGFVLGSDIAILRDIISSIQEKARNEVAAEALRAKTPPPSSQATNKPTDFTPPAKINNPSAYTPPAGGDSEGGANAAKNSGGAPTSQFGPGGLVLAGGAVADGRGASQFLKLQSGVKLEGLNPAFRTNLNGLIEEYGKLTGKFTQINSGVRTWEEQASLFKANPGKAAAPGKSLHEYGLAVDIPSVTLDEMDKLGLMRKYGFTRPVGGEPWHMEAAGTQVDIEGFKTNQAGATAAIAASLGKGGGGFGTVDGAKKYDRDEVLAKKLMDASVTAKDLTPSPAPIPDNSKELAAMNKTVKSSSGPTMIDVSKPEVKPVSSANSATDGEGKQPKLESSRAPSGGVGQVSGDQNKSMKDVTPGTGGKYSLLPEGNSGKGWNNQKDVILEASKMAGVDPKLTASVIAIESGFNPNAQAGTSSAAGLGQFTAATWKATVGKYGSKYGLDPNVSPMDPRANALMTAEYIKENAKSLSGTKSNLTGTDLYLAHFLGAEGAKKVLGADPSSSAASLLPNAAKSNPNIFYSGNNPRTVSDLYSLLDGKVKNKLSEHGVPSEYFPTGGLGLKLGSSISGIQIDKPASNDSVAKPAESSRAPGPTSPSSYQNNTVPTSSRVAAAVVAPMSDVSGFSGKQVQQSSSSDMSAAMGDVSTTLKQSLDVQTQTLAVLKSILEKSGNAINNAPEKTMVNDMKDSGSNSLSAQPRSSNKLVPVSMSRV